MKVRGVKKLIFCFPLDIILYCNELILTLHIYQSRKRDISGDDLRREFWVHEEATTPKKKKKTGIL